MRSRMRRRALLAIAVLAVLLAALVILIARPADESAPRPRVPERAGPVASRSVYWVGHSLMNARDDRVAGSESLLEKVGSLARARELQYRSFDHTLWGSPLSLLWRGRPHGWERDAPEMPARLVELRERGAGYDSMVLTEVIPLRESIRSEHSAFYVGRFACELVRQRPDAEIFLYHAWPHLQASDPDQGYGSPASYSFARRAREDRAFHDQLADRAAAGGVENPDPIARLGEPPTCALPSAIRIVPVGSVLAEIADRLERERVTYRGRDLAMTDLFFNPYLERPDGWPREDLDEPSARAILATMARPDPERPLDDIHPSDLGVYVSSLVHFAVLYRRSPIDLPPLADGLEPETARWLQEIVWEIVLEDPRAGVAHP